MSVAVRTCGNGLSAVCLWRFFLVVDAADRETIFASIRIRVPATRGPCVICTNNRIIIRTRNIFPCRRSRNIRLDMLLRRKPDIIMVVRIHKASVRIPAAHRKSGKTRCIFRHAPVVEIPCHNGFKRISIGIKITNREALQARNSKG